MPPPPTSPSPTALGIPNHPLLSDGTGVYGTGRRGGRNYTGKNATPVFSKVRLIRYARCQAILSQENRFRKELGRRRGATAEDEAMEDVSALDETLSSTRREGQRDLKAHVAAIVMGVANGACR